MHGNRFGHRLALNLVGGRAVDLLENGMNDGWLSIRNLQKQITPLFWSLTQWERKFLITACLTAVRLRLAQASFFFLSLSALCRWERSQHRFLLIDA